MSKMKALLRDYWVILLAPVLLLGPMLMQGQVLFWGTPSLQFVAWWTYAWEGLRQGVLPLWNPLNGMGAPLLANYQTAFFYPPNWLLLIFAAVGSATARGSAAPAIAWGYTFLALLHLAWGGLGMALLLRRLSFRWLAQIVGGLAYGLSGCVVARLGFFSMVWVAAWLPWVVSFADRIASPLPGIAASALPARRLRLVPGLVLCLAMQLLAGHAQLTWYTLLLTLAWVTVGALRAGGLRQVPWAWLSFGAAAGLAAGLAAVQLVPTFEYLRLSQRAGAVAYDDAMTYSFWPWRFLTLFAPDFFGSPSSGDFWGYASYWEDHLYAGLLPLLLALSTLWPLLKGLKRSSRKPRWGLLIFLWMGIALSFLLAMGRFTPVFPFLYRHVPTFSMFQAPARYLIWLAFALPLLAAVGIERWRCPTGRGLYWFHLATAGAFAITLGAGLAWLLMHNIRLTFIRAAALAGLWTLGVGLLTLLIPWAEKHGRVGLWQAAVIAWTLADLLFTGWGLNPGVSLAFYQGVSPAAQQAQTASAGQRVYLGRQAEYDLKFRRFFRFQDYAPLEDWREARSALIPNLNLLDGLPSANNFDPLVTNRYTRWMAEMDAQSPAVQQGWLAWMGVGAVEQIDGSQPSGVRFDPLPGAKRWRWAACARSVSGSEAAWAAILPELQAPPRPDRPLILEGGPVQSTPSCSPGTAGAVQPISERPDRLVLQVDATGSGWLEIADAWYPGWQAVVDGQNQPLYPADTLFRAVAVPSGKHQVILQYRPNGFYFGGLFSILMLLCITLLFTHRGRDSA